MINKKDLIYKHLLNIDTDKNCLRSLGWCLGGSARSWQGDKWEIQREEPRTIFTELDMFLFDIDPDLSYLKYRMIFDHSVTIESYDDSDYYHSKDMNRFSCDLDKLFDKLIEFGYKIK